VDGKRLLPDLDPRPAILAGVLFLSACASSSTATPFIPPTLSIQFLPLATAEPSIPLPPTPHPTPTIPPSPTPSCENGLTFIQDLTIEDGTLASAGQRLDKQWLVLNSGTCDWDARYRLRQMAGPEMGTAGEQALYPARAGTQAVLRLLLTAPAEPGIYRSEWRAIAPDGQAFGDPIYIEIIVQ